MQIRCTSCTRTISLSPGGELPTACPHCAGACIPKQLGPFVPLRLVATGGMGEVYLARHAELGTEVALKLLPAMGPAAAATVRERFAREARLTARVKHPGVVKVLDEDVAGDRPYLVLEFVDGQTLRELLHKGPLPVVEAARIAALTADVLAAAHREGVLHRDVKPDNVMLARDGSVRVLDFGIARAMTDDAPLTRTGEILGTPEYMAPEQLLDGPEATDERTDVHALGVLLYELLTDRSPFHGANLFQALKLVESLVPQKPSALRDGIPEALDAVVMQALQKRREDRPGTAAAFAAAVRAAVPAADASPALQPSPMVWFLWLPLAAVLVLGVSGFVLLRSFLQETLQDAVQIGTTVLGDLGRAAGATATRLLLEQQMLADGRWSRALQVAEQGVAADEPWLLGHAQDAFLFTHHVWPLAAGLPAWLGCCDERQRERLFGSSLETAEGADALARARGLLARGEPHEALALLQDFAAPDGLADLAARRLTLVAAHLVGADGAALRALPKHLGLASDATARLLSLRLLPASERAQAFVDYGALVPIEEPEHWLALRCADAHRETVDGPTAAQNAKMAWLNGAGELAVMLDAALPTLRRSGASPRVVPARLDQLLRRVGAADPADTPASVALRALLQFAPNDPDPAEQALAALPADTAASLQPFRDWLVASKAGEPTAHAVQRGLALARTGDLPGARSQFAAAMTPVANLCGWLLAQQAPADQIPTELPAPAFLVAAELVRGETAQIERLLAAAAARPEHRLPFLRLAVLAGAEVDFTVAPWNAFAESPAREAFEKEVAGGLRR